MILYMIITLATVAVAFTVSRQTVNNICVTRRQLLNNISLAAIFAVLTAACVLRTGVGNDYVNYIQNAHEINVGGVTVTEPGYNLFVKILYTLCGSENYLWLFGIIGCATVYLYLKALYDSSESFAMSFLLFMTLGIYFRSFNTVRYYFVLAITLYSLRYVVKKEYLKFILLIVFAAFFHKSVLVVIPLYYICNRKWNRYFYGIIGVGTAAAYLLRDYIMQLALKLYPSYENTIYLTEGVGLSESILSIGRCILILIMALICYETIRDDKANTLYFNMNILAIALYIGGSFIPLISRFGYYLITAQIILIPGILAKLEGRKKKYMTIAVVVFAVLYFAYFLKVAYEPGISVLPYKSWLFDHVEWNNVEENLMYNNR